MQQIFTNNFCEEEIIFQKAHLKPFQIFVSGTRPWKTDKENEWLLRNHYPRRISKISKAKTWIISRKARYTTYLFRKRLSNTFPSPIRISLFLISFVLPFEDSLNARRNAWSRGGKGRMVHSRPVIDELSRRVIRGERIRGEGFRDSRATPALPSPRP